MFTGIVTVTGEVDGIETLGGDCRLSIASEQLSQDELSTGESISVNGVCLTAASVQARGFVADVSAETLRITTLGGLTTGSRVNLEPSLRVGDRLGGHLVSGHVDCVGTVRERRDEARSIRLTVEVAPEYRRYLAKKGSVCMDGVSLTINAVSGNAFEVNIIPHTAEITIIGEYRDGAVVNIEVDLVARYLERLLTEGDDPGISFEYLKEHGYVR